MDLDNIEQEIVEKIIEKLETNTSLSNSDIDKMVEGEIVKANYLKESWQLDYAKTRIIESVYRIRAEKVLSSEKENSELIYLDKKPTFLAKIRCDECGHIDDPNKWGYRWFLMISYLFFTVFWFIFEIIFIFFVNPYICSNCGERNRLVKILNNQKQYKIKCYSKKTFIIISVLPLISLVIIILYIFL